MTLDAMLDAMPDDGVLALTVFCASSWDDEFGPLAEDFGYQAASRGILVIYGYGGAGLMGALATGARAAGGAVTGITPSDLFLDERASTPHGVEPLVTGAGLEGMQHRKGLMYRGADAFAVLPGGAGTMSEFWEAFEYSQLELHHRRPRKPLALLNWGGFYDTLVEQLDNSVGRGFLSPAHRELVHVADDASAALEQLGVPELPGPSMPAPHGETAPAA